MYEELVEIPLEQIVIVMAVENEKPLIFVKKTEDYINTLVKHINFYKDNKW